MEYIKKGFLLSIIMIVICGIIYPLIMTGIGQVLFPYTANGSMVEKDGKVIGSELIGQNYNDDKYFMGRVSAVDYNMNKDKKVASGSNNLGSTSEELYKRAEKDIKEFLKSNPNVKEEDISSELITESGSGLDPDITVKGANIQVDRVSEKTGISKEKLDELIKENTKGRFLGIYGEERVNVLNLNSAVENLLKK